MGEDAVLTGGDCELLPLPHPAPGSALDEDIYGPASFPASDPPSTWAGGSRE
jgi:hypothetical protein